MWFGVLISCIILMGDVFTIHCKSVGVDEKNVVLALNNYLMPPYTFPELHTGNRKTLNSATFFLTKSDRISLETSWLLKFEIWRVSISINCNFFRYFNQVSHKNNQPLPFFNFLTWYEVWNLSSNISLYEYPSGKTSWSLTHELYKKWYLICKLLTFFPWAKWWHLLSVFVKGYHWT